MVWVGEIVGLQSLTVEESLNWAPVGLVGFPADLNESRRREAPLAKDTWLAHNRHCNSDLTHERWLLMKIINLKVVLKYGS